MILNDDARNPFGSTAVAERQSEALVAVEQSRAIAETQAAMTIAKKFPRDPIAAMDRILNACTRATLAERPGDIDALFANAAASFKSGYLTVSDFIKEAIDPSVPLRRASSAPWSPKAATICSPES